MKIYTTVEPVPSRMLALARLLLAAGPLELERLLGLLQPREDSGMAKKTLEAAVEAGLVVAEKKTYRLRTELFSPQPTAADLDGALPIVLAPLLLAPTVNGERNGFATICAWLLLQPLDKMPVDRGGLKDALSEQGFSLDGLQARSDARWDNIIYWARYLGLLWQTKDEPCGGLVPDPTAFVRRHLATLLPAGEDVPAEAFRTTLGQCCPVLDGGSVRAEVLATTRASAPESQLSDALAFAIDRLKDEKRIDAWCPDDQRDFLLTPDERRIAFLKRLK